jgi:phospholipid/cholesterol/gamma-HCH transport system permease protein
MALQSSFMLKAVGGVSYLASGLGYLIFAEISPLLTTIILAARSGSSIAAEIANMSVCEEVKAIKAMAISPVQYLVVPRFIAMTICTPILRSALALLAALPGSSSPSSSLTFPLPITSRKSATEFHQSFS